MFVRITKLDDAPRRTRSQVAAGRLLAPGAGRASCASRPFVEVVQTASALLLAGPPSGRRRQMLRLPFLDDRARRTLDGPKGASSVGCVQAFAFAFAALDPDFVVCRALEG